jgi:hypothetical protein
VPAQAGIQASSTDSTLPLAARLDASLRWHDGEKQRFRATQRLLYHE